MQTLPTLTFSLQLVLVTQPMCEQPVVDCATTTLSAGCRALKHVCHSWTLTLNVQVLHRPSVTVIFWGGGPTTRDDLCHPVLCTQLILDPLVNAEIVQAHARSYEGSSTVKAHFQWLPQDTPSVDQDTESTLNGHAIRALVKIIIIEVPRK